MASASSSGTSFRRPLSVCVPAEDTNCAHAAHTDTLFSPGCTTPGHSFNSLRVRHAQARSGTDQERSTSRYADVSMHNSLPAAVHACAGSKQEGTAACLVWSAGMHEQGRCQALTEIDSGFSWREKRSCCLRVVGADSRLNSSRLRQRNLLCCRWTFHTLL